MRVLVTGGAGYIGSHTVVSLIDAGHSVEVLDSLVNAKASVLPRLEALTGQEIPFHHVDLCDRAATSAVLADGDFDAVIHFAGLKAVGESSAMPLRYYDNNLVATISLAHAMIEHGVEVIVFSSSATVYGPQAPVPYSESFDALSSSNPYGRTKLMQEEILRDLAAAGELRVANLRYFNPVGAHPSGTIGEDPQGVPNNLMPFVAQVAVGRRDRLQVFGGDYPTADGTAERDYLHVQDLAAGHVAALEYLAAHPEVAERPWNLGRGQATSVLELVRAFEKSTDQAVPYEMADRRAGDLPAFWADASRAASELGWKAEHDLEEMCEDTWRWQSGNPEGYPD